MISPGAVQRSAWSQNRHFHFFQDPLEKRTKFDFIWFFCSPLAIFHHLFLSASDPQGHHLPQSPTSRLSSHRPSTSLRISFPHPPHSHFTYPISLLIPLFLHLSVHASLFPLPYSDPRVLSATSLDNFDPRVAFLPATAWKNSPPSSRKTLTL